MGLRPTNGVKTLNELTPRIKDWRLKWSASTTAADRYAPSQSRLGNTLSSTRFIRT